MLGWSDIPSWSYSDEATGIHSSEISDFIGYVIML